MSLIKSKEINQLYEDVDLSYSQFMIDAVKEVYCDLEDWNDIQLQSKIYDLENILEIIKEGKDKEMLKRLIKAIEEYEEK